jgi:O-antigen ligase
MGISKKKRQIIKRNYPARSVDELAAQTGLPAAQVERVLGIDPEARQPDMGARLDRVLEWGIPGCLFVAPFVMIPGLRDASNLPQNAFVQVSTWVLAMIWMIRAVYEKKMDLPKIPVILPLGAFLVWGAVAMSRAVNFYEGVPQFFQGVSMGVFLLLTTAVFAGKEMKYFDRAIIALVLAGTGIALIGICQHLFEFSAIPQARPPAATFSNRNMASQFMVMVLPLSLYLFLRARDAATAWLAVPAPVLMLVYVVYIRSLAGWVCVIVQACLLAGILVFMAKKRLMPDGTRAGWKAGTAGVVMFLVMINLDSQGIDFRFGGLADEAAVVREFVVQPDSGRADGSKTEAVSTLQWRWSIWANTLAMAKDHPVTGVGPGNFRVVYPLYNQAVIKDQKFNIETQPIHTHNDYIQVFVEYGLPGLLIIAWAMGCFFYMAAGVLKKSAEQSPGAGQALLLAVVLTLSALGIMINAGFSFPFQRAIPPYMLMAVTGMMGVLFIRSRLAEAVISRNTKLIRAGAACVFILLGAVLFFHYNALQFDRYYGRTINAYNQTKWNFVLQEAKRAEKYSQGRPDLLSFYAGFACDKTGEYEKSIEHYTRLLQFFPNYLNGLINLGIAYGKTDQDGSAVKTYKQVVRIMPDDFKFYNDIGHHYQKMGKQAEAYHYFSRAAELNENNAVVQVNLGIVCMALKQMDQAQAAFQRASEIKPDWEKPVQFLKMIDNKRHEGLDD